MTEESPGLPMQEAGKECHAAVLLWHQTPFPTLTCTLQPRASASLGLINLTKGEKALTIWQAQESPSLDTDTALNTLPSGHPGSHMPHWPFPGAGWNCSAFSYRPDVIKGDALAEDSGAETLSVGRGNQALWQLFVERYNTNSPCDWASVHQP